MIRPDCVCDKREGEGKEASEKDVLVMQGLWFRFACASGIMWPCPISAGRGARLSTRRPLHDIARLAPLPHSAPRAPGLGDRLLV